LKDFPGADGIKTGYLHEAGHCFVGSATRKHWRLIAVALDSGRCREDVESLLNYGFANYHAIIPVHQYAPLGTIAAPTAAGPVPIQAAKDVVLVLPKKAPTPSYSVIIVPAATLPAAPIDPGTKLGTVNVICDGKTLASGDAVATPSVATIIVGRGSLSWLYWVSFAVVSLFALGNTYAGKKKRGKQRETRAGEQRWRYRRARAAAKDTGVGGNRLTPDVRSLD
jgi:D-alanyl-D-alanine carboxypeptidase